MKNRYEVIKKLYPEYIIILIKKAKYITIDTDKEIMDYLKIDSLNKLKKFKMNYLILDNLEIVDIKEYNQNNNYKIYYLRLSILKIIYKIKKRVENHEKNNINNDHFTYND